MKKSILLTLLAAALAATAIASTTLTEPAETQDSTVLKFSSPKNVAMTVATATTSSPLSGTANPVSLYLDGSPVTLDVTIVRFTVEAHSDNLIDEVVVMGRTTSNPSSSYTTTFVLGYDDEIVESQSLSLSSTPEPARTSLLALGLGAFALRRRRR